MFTFKRTYFLLAVLLFVIEVLIALYVSDRFVRPYLGDYLVVFLVYCALRAVVNWPVLTAAIFTLLFAYLVELLQYLNLVGLLGLQKNKLATVVLGSSFEWIDMLAYTLGVLTILVIEHFCRPEIKSNATEAGFSKAAS